MTKTDDVARNSETKTLPSETEPSRPAVIAVRKTCDAEGTGLSHFVLMDKQVQR